MASVTNCPPDGCDRLTERKAEQRPPTHKTGVRRALSEGMTDAQRQFAADHHNLIYTFLHEKGWAPDEYYDIAALGFLRSVMRYLSEPHLHRYPFSTIAWRAMGQSISAYHRAEARRIKGEQEYLLTAQSSVPDPFEEMETKLLLHTLAAVSGENRYRLAVMRLHGYSIAETARAQGMSPKRVRKMLREMYLVYLKLYKT